MGTFVLITLVINGAITRKTLTIIILMEVEVARTLYVVVIELQLSAETFEICEE